MFLGIDVGTSSTKTLAVNSQGEILGESVATYPLHHPRPLWSEQDPEDWWRATKQTIQAVLQQIQACRFFRLQH